MQVTKTGLKDLSNFPLFQIGVSMINLLRLSNYLFPCRRIGREGID